MWLFWLFVAIPIVEIALFIQVGGLIGLWPTLAIVILTAVIGSSLMRSQGASALAEVQRSFNELRDPSRPLAHGVMILIAGMLLLTPGFFTDTVGLLLLVPKLRDRVMNQLSRHVRVSGFSVNSGMHRRDTHRAPYGEGVIDGEYEVTEPHDGNGRRTPTDLPPELEGDDQPPRGNSGWTRH
ncbi:FxsA family protein [Paracoccus sp. Z330]|uniref:FxsA family protein n=1 Tax=Paracoccus onchidii TaxID=3017813 RepID=A0ABT4ZFP4_9RHOB|nr:FxsA family protein [Paracoccus onchidii]MDB6178122.1 FxsA family protein [Paracoccus onchidii]